MYIHDTPVISNVLLIMFCLLFILLFILLRLAAINIEWIFLHDNSFLIVIMQSVVQLYIAAAVLLLLLHVINSIIIFARPCIHWVCGASIRPLPGCGSEVWSDRVWRLWTQIGRVSL